MPMPITYNPQGSFSSQGAQQSGFPQPFTAPQPGFFKGTPSQIQPMGRFTGGQQQLMQQLQQLLGGTGGLMSQATQRQSFEPFAQEARQQFSQQTVPGLAERFTSLGGGALSSPSFASQLGGAGAQLEQGLAGEKGRFELGQQGMQQNLFSGILSTLMQPQFENVTMQGQPGELMPILGLLARLAMLGI